MSLIDDSVNLMQTTNGSVVPKSGETMEEYQRRTAADGLPSYNYVKIRDSEFVGNLPFAIRILGKYKDFEEALKDELTPETLSKPGVAEMMMSDDESPIPFKYMKENRATTAVGGNDAINCYCAFCENDDIIYPLHSVNGSTENGLGRVYAEMYERHQKVLWLSFGVPVFKGGISFFKDAACGELTSLAHSGTVPIHYTIGRLIGSTITLPFKIALFPWYVADGIARVLSRQDITKYYDFNPTMPMYYGAVNSLMAMTAVNLGLTSYDSSEEFPTDNLPEILKEGIDIYKIIGRRYRAATSKRAGTDTRFKEHMDETKGKEGWVSQICTRAASSFKQRATDGDMFVGFRVEKSTESTESFSNETGQSSLQQSINSTASSMMEKKFSLSNGQTGSDILDGVTSAAMDVLKGTLSGVGLDGLAGVALGSGMIDIPEVWKNSNFVKSYSFTIPLRSPYGDTVSIYQNLYIPTFMLLAGALPKAIGNSMYTAPFSVRCYCQGMFTVPNGIIDSLTIKRGGAEYGWSYKGLPTAIDITMTIKDLSPILFLSLAADDTSLLNVFNSNSAMQEYMLTLSGIGLRDRTLLLPNLKRKFKAALKMKAADKWLNPEFWGGLIGGAAPTRAISLLGWSNIPRN